MKRMLLHSNKGITLVELLIASAILAVVISAASGVLSTGIKTYNANVKSTISQQSMRSAMVTIAKNVREYGTAVPAPTSLTVNGVAYTVNASTKTLMYGSSDIAYNITDISSQFVSGYNNKVIKITLTSTSGRTLSTQVHLN